MSYAIQNLPILTAAYEFAELAHAGQVRKYTGDPYITHPVSVANTLVLFGITDADTLCAALLHDTVEDTGTSLEDIKLIFGAEVAQLVSELTDISKPSDGNRAKRKAIDREHTARASAKAKTIKLADLIDNTRCIVANDPDFARVYLVEKLALLEVLLEGDAGLWLQADLICRTGLVAVGRDYVLHHHDAALARRAQPVLTVDDHFA